MKISTSFKALEAVEVVIHAEANSAHITGLRRLRHRLIYPLAKTGIFYSLSILTCPQHNFATRVEAGISRAKFLRFTHDPRYTPRRLDECLACCQRDHSAPSESGLELPSRPDSPRPPSSYSLYSEINYPRQAPYIRNVRFAGPSSSAGLYQEQYTGPWANPYGIQLVRAPGFISAQGNPSDLSYGTIRLPRTPFQVCLLRRFFPSSFRLIASYPCSGEQS